MFSDFTYIESILWLKSSYLFFIVCYCLLGTGGALWVCRCTMLTVEDIGSVTLPEGGLASGRLSSCCTIFLHTKTHGCLWLRCAMHTCFFFFLFYCKQRTKVIILFCPLLCAVPSKTSAYSVCGHARAWGDNTYQCRRLLYPGAG